VVEIIGRRAEEAEEAEEAEGVKYFNYNSSIAFIKNK
jgi:hypothetical protein